MAIMKKQVNFFLLVLIVIGIAMIAGMSTLYQDRLAGLGNQYLETSEQLSACNQTLAQKVQELERTRQQLSANIGDVNQTVNLYQQAQEEVAQKDTVISEKDDEIERLREQLSERQSTINQLRAEIEDKDNQIAALQAEITRLDENIEELEEDLENC